MENIEKVVARFVSDKGDAGKSIGANIITCSLQKHFGYDVAKIDLDKNNHHLSDAFAQRNANGEIKSEQDAVKGCQLIDMDDHPEIFTDAVGYPAPVVILDTPARAQTAAAESLGTGQSQIVLDTYYYSNAIELAIIPWTDDDKSPKAIDKFYQEKSILDFSNYENPNFKIHVVLLKNFGIMNSKSKLTVPSVLKFYEDNLSIQAMKSDPRFMVHEIDWRVQLNQPALDVLTTNANGDKAFNSVLNALKTPKLTPAVNALLMAHFNEAKKVAQVIDNILKGKYNI